MEEQIMQTPGDAGNAFSYIFPIGYQNSSECGYCRGHERSNQRRKRFSYYAGTSTLTPRFYQGLVDRCWRRSGTLLYRPNQKGACCPHYTLRLDTSAFKATKDQRQAINRFNKYVIGDSYAAAAARLTPRSREETRRREAVFDLVERIHEAERANLPDLPMASGKAHEPAHNFTVTLETDVFTEEKYAVFENYQRIVHKEPPYKISRSGFRRFLCDSPIERATVTGPDGKERKLGSYHQCYRLDGVLVAIGVLDLLPECVSAVYFLYHESIHSHNPGKLGALREIALALEGGYRWWYSGYYIHTCTKMRYKMDYAPQYILNPDTLTWHPLAREDMGIFDENGYAAFSSGGSTSDRSPPPRAVDGGAANDENGLAQDRLDVASGSKTEADDADTGQPDADKQQSSDETPPTGENPDGDGYDDDGDDNDGEEETDFLLTSNMPGILTLEQIRSLNLDSIPILTDYQKEPFLTSDLAIWGIQTFTEVGGLKSKIGELVAALGGADLLPELCLDFRRASRP